MARRPCISNARASRTARSLLPLAVGPAMSASGGLSPVSKDFSLLIARLIADTDTLATNLDRAREELGAKGWPVAMAEPVKSGMEAIELQLPHGEAAGVRT